MSASVTVSGWDSRSVAQSWGSGCTSSTSQQDQCVVVLFGAVGLDYWLFTLPILPGVKQVQTQHIQIFPSLTHSLLSPPYYSVNGLGGAVSLTRARACFVSGCHTVNSVSCCTDSVRQKTGWQCHARDVARAYLMITDSGKKNINFLKDLVKRLVVHKKWPTFWTFLLGVCVCNRVCADVQKNRSDLPLSHHLPSLCPPTTNLWRHRILQTYSILHTEENFTPSPDMEIIEFPILKEVPPGRWGLWNFN